MHAPGFPGPNAWLSWVCMPPHESSVACNGSGGGARCSAEAAHRPLRRTTPTCTFVRACVRVCAQEALQPQAPARAQPAHGGHGPGSQGQHAAQLARPYSHQRAQRAPHQVCWMPCHALPVCAFVYFRPVCAFVDLTLLPCWPARAGPGAPAPSAAAGHGRALHHRLRGGEWQRVKKCWGGGRLLHAVGLAAQVCVFRSSPSITGAACCTPCFARAACLRLSRAALFRLTSFSKNWCPPPAGAPTSHN